MCGKFWYPGSSYCLSTFTRKKKQREKKIMFKYLILLGMLTACATGRYERAMKTCNTKCYPQVAVDVEYNYSNNRYDKCVCKTEFEAQGE